MCKLKIKIHFEKIRYVFSFVCCDNNQDLNRPRRNNANNTNADNNNDYYIATHIKQVCNNLPV